MFCGASLSFIKVNSERKRRATARACAFHLSGSLSCSWSLCSQELWLGSSWLPPLGPGPLGTSLPTHQGSTAAVALPQEKIQSPHRRHPLNVWLWWPGMTVHLSPIGHLLNKTTPSRLREIAYLSNTQEKTQRIGQMRRQKNMFQSK